MAHRMVVFLKQLCTQNFEKIAENRNCVFCQNIHISTIKSISEDLFRIDGIFVSILSIGIP